MLVSRLHFAKEGFQQKDNQLCIILLFDQINSIFTVQKDKRGGESLIKVIALCHFKTVVGSLVGCF